MPIAGPGFRCRVKIKRKIFSRITGQEVCPAGKGIKISAWTLKSLFMVFDIFIWMKAEAIKATHAWKQSDVFLKNLLVRLF